MTKISQNQTEMFKLRDSQETKKTIEQAIVQSDGSIFGEKVPQDIRGGGVSNIPENLFDIINNNIKQEYPDEFEKIKEFSPIPSPLNGGMGAAEGSFIVHETGGSAGSTGSATSFDVPDSVTLTGSESLDELAKGRQQAIEDLRHANMRGTKQEYLADSKKDVDDKKKAYDEAVENLSSEDEEVQAQIDDIKDRKAQNDEALSAKETEVEAMSEMSDEMKSDMYNIEDQLSATQEQVDEVNANIENKEATVQDLESQLGSLQAPNQADYKKTDKNGNEVSDYEAYGKAMAEYEKQKAELEEQINAAKEEISALQEELDQLTQQTDKLEYEKQYIEQELAEIEEQITTAEEELDKLKEEADSIEQELGELIENDSDNKIQGKEEVSEAMAAFDAAKETFALTENMYDSYNALQKNVLEGNVNTYDKAIEEAKENEKEEEKNKDKDEDNNESLGSSLIAPNWQKFLNRENELDKRNLITYYK